VSQIPPITAANVLAGEPSRRGYSHRPLSRSALALLPFCFAYYVSYLLRTINAVIAPELVRDLGLGAADLGFLTSTYFLAFALAQIPVGLALDRFGPRRVVALLLVATAAGAALFAGAGSFPLLAAGRTASLPLEWALPRIGWRGSLAVGAMASALAAVLVATAAPRRGPAEPDLAPSHTLASVFRSRAFWRFAPQAALFTGGFMALQGLWIVPWLIAVEGSSRAEAAIMLLWLNVGLLAGQLVVSFGAGALHRAGVGRARLMFSSILIALLAEALIGVRLAHGAAAWFVLGVGNVGSAQVYGIAAAQFPPQLSGRVSTALNQLAFAGAFAVQWGVGLLLQKLTPLTGELRAYQVTFAALWVAQLAGVLVSLYSTKRSGMSSPPP
jgi:predicted MFS family arabinose efflux permease